jgi:hypothetical protein
MKKTKKCCKKKKSKQKIKKKQTGRGPTKTKRIFKSFRTPKQVLFLAKRRQEKINDQISKELSKPIEKIVTDNEREDFETPVSDYDSDSDFDKNKVDPDDLVPYLTDAYAPINAFLRNPEDEELEEEEIEEAKIEIQKIDKVFNDYGIKVTKPIYVYRGMRSHRSENEYNGVNLAYSSTCFSKRRTGGIAIMSYAKPNGDLLILKLMPGVRYLDVNDIVSSDEIYRNEEEYLIDRNVVFTVTKMFDIKDLQNPFRSYNVYTYLIDVNPM